MCHLFVYHGTTAFELSILNCFAKKCRAKEGKIAEQAKFFLTLAKCFTDLAKLFSINCELDFINIAMLFSFSLDSDNYFSLVTLRKL